MQVKVISKCAVTYWLHVNYEINHANYVKSPS